MQRPRDSSASGIERVPNSFRQFGRVQYAGGASGLVAGVMQVNAVVPKGIASGSAVPVTIEVGGVSSQAGVTLAVK